MDDIEHNLTRYMGTVSIVNMGVGFITAIAAYLMGFPNPVLWGVLAFVFNYVPYIGPAVMVIVLFCVGLVIFPSFAYALIENHQSNAEQHDNHHRGADIR